MNISVTGAGGLVGRHVVRCLKAGGHQVVGLVRNSGSSDEGPQMIGDLLDDHALTRLVREADAVVHCAALLSGGDEDLWLTNVIGAKKLVSAALDRQIVHISSISVYAPSRQPSIAEDSPLVTGSRGYAASKREAERVLPPHAVIIRPAYIYGPGDRSFGPHLSRFLESRLAFSVGSGENRMPLVHAETVALAVRLSLEKGCRGPFNVCDDGVLTQTRFLELACQSYGRPVPRALPRVFVRLLLKIGAFGQDLSFAASFLGSRARFSSDRARQELGLVSPVSYEQGLSQVFQRAVGGPR